MASEPATVVLGTKMAKSAPNVYGDTGWFQGADDLLYCVHLNEPSVEVNPQGLKTMSTPMPSVDGHVYFQGEGLKLIKMQQRFPYLHANLAGASCTAPPVAPGDGFVYYRDGIGRLARVGTSAASAQETLQFADKTAFTPALAAEDGHSHVFFAAEGTLRRKRAKRDAPDSAEDFGNYTLKDAPFIGDNEMLYIVDNKNDAYQIDPLNVSNAIKLFGDCGSTPRTSEFGDDGNIYWQGLDDGLYMASRGKPGAKTKVNNNNTCGPPDPQGDGHIVFWGVDTKIYRTKIGG